VTLSITFRQPAFTAPEAEAIARRRFGMSGTARPLPSERDQNFLVRLADGRRVVLKIAHVGEDRAVLELQNLALRRLAESAPEVALPRVLPTVDGAEIADIPSAEGDLHYTRLLSWVPGTVLADVHPHTPELLESLGRVIGQVGVGLDGLDHPAARRELKWDLARAGWIREHLDTVSDARRRALVERILEHFDSDITPVFKSLHAGLVYNDANDHNVLVRGDDPWARRVVGVIDFGDLVHGPVVCDVAIAAAYALLGKPDPLAAAARVTAGYHAVRPLEAAGIDLLDGLIATRLAVTVVNAAREAFVEGWRTSMWIGVAMAAVGFAFVAVRGPARRSAPTPEVELELELELELAAVTD